MNRINHYKWLDRYLPEFFEAVGVGWEMNGGIIGAHGDKCYTFKRQWEDANIPFPHGVAIYLLTYCRPFCDQVHETENGWVNPNQWVVDNYRRFSPHLPEVRPRLDEWLPQTFLFDYPEAKTARTMLDQEVIKEYDGCVDPWPGKHKNVIKWVDLENGYAVGCNQSPQRGYAFPVIKR